MAINKRIIPILILGIGLISFFAFDLQGYLSLEALEDNYEKLQDITQKNYLLSILIYMLSYVLVVAFSVPGATVMTLLGGFLFGISLGTALAVISATCGATITFLAMKTAFSDTLIQKSGNFIKKMRDEFKKDEFNYLIFLRLVPIFPFFVINVAAGYLGVKLKSFFIGTLLGIIPGTFVYASTGNGLGFAISMGKEINLSIIFTLPILLPIFGLSILAILPVIYKRMKKQ